MKMSTTPTSKTAVQVSGVTTVGIPVTDQDRAVEFYVGVLGLEKRLDVPTPGGGRWIVVAPTSSSGTTLALVAAHDGVPAGVETGIRLTTPDAEAAHSALLSRGVEAGDVLRWPGVPAMFSFRDQDGNRLELVEPAAPSSRPPS
jgi:catechol 2,3-dioxygenase-like lactoylglutathione lyase family enzyme